MPIYTSSFPSLPVFLLDEASATLAPFRLASFPSPFSHYLLAYAFSSCTPLSLSFSSYLDMMSRRERERERGRGVLDEIPFDRRFEDLLLLATVTRQRVVGSAATERTGVEKD